MPKTKLTKLQAETLQAVADGKVHERNCGYGAFRIFGANPSAVGRLRAMGLIRWTKVGGDAVLTEAGCAARAALA